MKREDIEKAAREEAEKKECLVYYGGTAISQDDLEESFIHGADWRINSVWHDASEKPEPSRYVLVEHKEDSNYSIVVYFGKPKDTSEWLRWAYIEDLLPDTED